MFHYTNQNTARRLASSERLMSETAAAAAATATNSAVYFHPYNVTSAPARATDMSHARSTSDFTYHSHHQYMMEEEQVVDLDEEPMDILYEREVHSSMGDLRRGGGHHRHHSEPANGHCAVSNIELQLANTADNLMGLLQREANDYSAPLPVCYYPTEFAHVDAADNDGEPADDKSKKPTIGPWRKRIASWMYDVVDHFQYDRNVVSIALRYIDQYVGHLLLENAKVLRRGDSGIGSSRGTSSSSGQPIKRRHFQLIAVTSLYLAIKVHGELMENDPITGAEYDVVASLVHEVDGRAFLGKPLAKDQDTIDEDEDASSSESDEELHTVQHKISDLKRRQRKGRWGSRLSAQFGLPLTNKDYDRSQSAPNSFNARPKMPKAPHSELPYKPRKRGMLGGPLRLHSFVELSRGLFTAKDISDTETKILKALNYVVNPPTSRRFTGEMLRLLALCYTGAVDECTINAAATASATERMLGLDRKDVLSKVLKNACAQIEGAASVPSLSIGCLPSVVAYSAVLNAVEEEFEKIQIADGSKDAAMEMEKNATPQLEDFQRHYRRYSRNQSPSNSGTSAASNTVSDKELFLEAWKEQFLVTVFHATNCFLSPESEDIFKVQELLFDQVKDTGDAAAAATLTSSPTEGGKQGSIKKRSPRSPRSVIFSAGGSSTKPRRGSSFFSRGNSSTSSANATLLSPYDSRGRASIGSSIGSSSNINVGEPSVFRRSSASTAHAAHPHRAYYKQTSEPIVEATAMPSRRFARSQTPDESHFRSHEMVRQRVGSSNNYEPSSWRSSTGEAFQPPNPNPPFFSA